MASWIMFGVLLILLETHYVSGICEEYYFDADTKNVSLTFKFVWETNETKHVRCLHDNKIIGECYKISNFVCPLEPTSTGVYSMSTGVDLPVVNVTIKTFDCATSGNYSCFKYPGTPNITKCAKDSSTLRPNTTSDTGDSTKICTIARGVIGGFGLLCIVIAIPLLVRDVCDEQLFTDCCTKTRCWTISSLFFGVCIVVMAMGIVDFTTPCEEGWSELNVFAIVFGSVGDALLIVTCIVTIVIERSSIRTSTKDLHYGLVHSHFTDFNEIYAKSASKQLFKDLGTEYTSKIIESFLLVIPNNCELILPTSEKLTSSATCRMKEITLQLEKEVNVDKHKLKLYKLKTEEDEYYVIAEVPTVLTVISLLSQTLRGKTIAGVVRQKFQLLYQSELIPHKLNNTVQFVTCKGKDDIARALFEVAKALFNAAKEPAASEKAPQTTCVSRLMKCCKECQECTHIVTPEATILKGDMIPGLAWDYVHNYLMKDESPPNAAFSALGMIHKGFAKKIIIVWVRTCENDPSLKNLVKKSNPNLEVEELPGQGHSNGVMFKHQDNEFIWAEYCTSMQCIHKERNTSAGKHAHGTRFKKAFDEIMSKTSIEQHFTDIKVSLIYFDDRDLTAILTDDTNDLLPDVVPALRL